MTILADDELAIASELIGRLVSDGLDGERPPDSAIDLEELALSTQAPFCWPGSPPEFAHALVRELSGRGDELAAGLLAAMARLAGEPLAGLAEAESNRLAARGISSPHADAVGRLELVEARRLEVGGGAEVWLAVLGRPGQALVQPLTLQVVEEPCGAVIVGALLGEPITRDGAAGVLDGAFGTPRPVAADELTRRLGAALDHMVRHDVALDFDAGRLLPLLERALTGHAGRLPRPPADAPDPDAADQTAAELLVDAFAQHLERTSVAADLLEHAPFVAHTMLDWKIDYADGELLRWGLGDLREFMLDWFPRKVTCEPETIAATPAAMIAFLGFLEVAGLLEAPAPLASLTAAVKRLAPRFTEACGDPRTWGMAKTMAYRMHDEGVDLEDPEAVREWLESYNARPFEDRGAIVGPPAREASAAGRRQRRKAARQARKRNRR